MKVGIGKAAEILGVHPETLRRWENSGKIEVERTPTNRRQYDLSILYGLVPRPPQASRATLCYARVSSRDQKDDLETQVALLESFWTHETVTDLGSGMNYNKRGLQGPGRHQSSGTHTQRQVAAFWR